jgi:hypothetical protein
MEENKQMSSMTLLPNVDRVRIWNTLFRQAWSEALAIARRSHKTPKKSFSPPSVLSDDEESRLVLLAFCTLAVEARTNHLIDELVEKGRLTKEEAGSVQRLPADTKWFLLPKLAGVKKRLNRGRRPHQAVAEICARRNVIFHVNFRRLNEGLPESGKMLSLFRDFVEAMEDMNVVLKRVKRPRRRVLDIGRFL